MQIVTNKGSRLFLILGGFLIANALIAEFIGVKIFSLESTLGVNAYEWNLLGVQGSLQFTAGVLLWPIVFIMTDIINEYFGQKGVKFLSYLAASLIAYGFVMIYMAILLVPASWWINSNVATGVPDMQAAFSNIFGQGLWIIVASLTAFFVGQLVDVFIFHRIKKWTGEKYIWLRATGSTAISQFIDSFLVIYIAFVIGSNWTMNQFLAIAMVNYVYKISVAVLLTPALYGVHYAIDRYLGHELATQMKTDAMEDK